MKTLIILLISCVGLIMIALQNTSLVEFNFLFWHFTLTSSLLIITTFLLGLAVGMFLTIPSLITKTIKIANQQKNIMKMAQSKDIKSDPIK